MKSQLERRAAAQDTAIVEAPTDFTGMPIVINDAPTWIEIMPDDAVFGASIQRVWRVIIAPFRALAVIFLLITERWYTFALIVATIVTMIVIYATR
ncbi:hypothetical protein OG884_17435 [Streptosporangium sp. NBC_01755]|uniref:hypothetical protein n=1 Tax=Streptosporangium sp. NBC_01755 TaxID=2975949 RepID=UPI002DDAAFBC|nr:hypothetical protein [Streptosporangium sp. NBC_01755]WSD03593.1 hypothetical protein OG884_17435 [Streptosporangium sp. NBC_01755]